ncbi:DUF3604 domain-containing protein [Luminiphilus syltensis]|nr:DUF3604 domain-containing protein [Luminiphilus syltensis]
MKNRPLIGLSAALLIGGALSASPTLAGEALIGDPNTYSPPARQSSRQLYWGDTHLHTTQSPDAFTLETRLDREQAYRFARGETVIADNGMAAKLRRPLDFLAITDHSEYLGVFPMLEKKDPRLKEWQFGDFLGSLMDEGKFQELALEFSLAIQKTDAEFKVPTPVRQSIWEDVTQTADQYYQPGVFTTLIGYEWTSMITGDNLHRVVLFKGDHEQTHQVLPFTAQHSTAPEDLWAALTDYERTTGGEVLAIAHNGNVSNGRMFGPIRENGKAFDAAYATQRARWEPVYEVTQVKGDGETHPALSPDDEFADFETWDDGNIALTADKDPDMLPYEYARSALQLGLGYERELGVNPFKFGLIGSSDMHTGLSTTAENNYFGKFGHDEPAKDRFREKMAHQLQENWRLVASGLAAVWAEDNTRESIFEAFKRREVYATSGSRIGLRFFAGWDFEAQDVQRPDYADIGYRKGVPMGGDLVTGPDGASPTIMVAAVRDPDGANLDRVQIIKGWLDADGETHEQVFDVALSDNRQADPSTGLIPPVGDTADLENATYLNSIGDAELAAVWQDPDFDPTEPAFYYARVIEIPTPRWTVYDAAFFGSDIPDPARIAIQDRAYSSPIWYTPPSPEP